MCLLSKYVLQSLAHLLIVLTLPCRAVFNFFLIVFFFFFLRQSHYVDLKILIILPQPPEYWDYRCDSPCLGQKF
jgi:hypothetical protein